MMPAVGGGMYTGDVELIHDLDFRRGTRVRVLIAADPAYGDIEAEEGQPEPTLNEGELAFWQGVLDRQAELLAARNAAAS